MKLKIGILTKDFKKLSNWELRIFRELTKDVSFDVVIIQQTDGLTSLKKSRFVQFFSVQSLARLLLSIQFFIEKRFFFQEVSCVDKDGLLQTFNGLPKIELKSASTNLHQDDLDVIINLGCIIVEELITIAKFGVWDFFFENYLTRQNQFTGFLTVLQKKETISSKLVRRITPTKVEVIDITFFNRSWSAVETALTAKEGSVSLIVKHLRRLQKGHEFNTASYSIQKYKYPKLLHVLKYSGQFYSSVFTKIKQKAAYKFWSKRYECWSIFMAKGDFFESSRASLKPLSMPKDEFWADPFLFNHNGDDYVFFENYSYKTKRGKISCGKVSGNELTDIVDVLNFEYHLSFPFIFEEEGNIYLMPETAENRRLEIYKAVNFPTTWELYATAFEGERVADAFFFDDEQNQKWLFLNKQAAETAPLNSELYIYKVDSVKLNTLQPHTQNPVIIDARTARNAGSIFTYKGNLYRPSQRNIESIYGRALNINSIKKLTIDEYEEENTMIFEPDFDENLIATHHLHQNNGCYVFDAAFKVK